MFSLLFLVAGGFTFVFANGFFMFQKYALLKVASKIPYMSRLLLTADSLQAPENDVLETSKEKVKYDFLQYKKDHEEDFKISESFPSLISAVTLGLISILLGFII